MTTIYGYLVQCDGRSLFLREKADAMWAYEDEAYTVVELVGKDELVAQASPDFDAYREVAESLYQQQQDQIDSLKAKLEEFVEVVEAIVEIATPTENIIENKAIIMLVNQQCKKLLEAEES